MKSLEWVKKNFFSQRKTKGNTKITIEDNELRLVYHSTTIGKIDKDGKVYVNNGGWDTSTTKERINKFLMACYQENYLGSRQGISQKKFIWYWNNDEEYSNGEVPFVRKSSKEIQLNKVI